MKKVDSLEKKLSSTMPTPASTSTTSSSPSSDTVSLLLTALEAFGVTKTTDLHQLRNNFDAELARLEALVSSVQSDLLEVTHQLDHHHQKLVFDSPNWSVRKPLPWRTSRPTKPS